MELLEANQYLPTSANFLGKNACTKELTNGYDDLKNVI